ncbi:hypothetical protein [Glycomyces dulcitolivorans]|uniref:hypothetical protein n=1 Tax=Glycomyces dulcitolivorans TaxID=2200759 RepID=UPI000DD47CF1|nr:hypothetical protein [Glycomyces dulcitolivorans]
MPGEFHEILVKLVQDEPDSVAWLLGRAGGKRGATCVAAETRTGSVGSPGPTERRADGVVLLKFLGSIEDPGRAADFAKYLLTTLAKEPATLLEALMKTGARLYHSEYTDELLDQGAIRQSRAILIRMLEAEGPVSAERREEIEACSDLAQLDAWITEHIRPAKG